MRRGSAWLGRDADSSAFAGHRGGYAAYQTPCLRDFLKPRALSVVRRHRFEVLEMLRAAFRAGPFEKKAVPEVY